MPSRILSSRIHVSNSISKLNPLEEVVFIHLIVSCDDYGRFYGDPDILKGQLFPKRAITVRQIEDAICKLEQEGMLRRYKADGLDYLYLTAWYKYQTPRAKTSRFPEPTFDVPTDDSECRDLDADDSECEQMQTDDCKPAQVQSPEFISLILNDKTYYPVSVAAIDRYKELYPAVDVEQELRNMVGWLESNPAKRKTRTGVASFITRWLSKAQNEGRARPMPKPVRVVPEGANPFRNGE